MPRPRQTNTYRTHEDGYVVLTIGGDDGTAVLIDADMELAFRQHEWTVRHDRSRSFVVSVRRVYAHNLVLGGSPPDGMVAYYRNANQMDLRRANLEFAPRGVAYSDVRALSSNTGYRGVQRRGNSYYARMFIDGKRVVKHFHSLSEAREWRESRERELVGKASSATPYEIPIDRACVPAWFSSRRPCANKVKKPRKPKEKKNKEEEEEIDLQPDAFAEEDAAVWWIEDSRAPPVAFRKRPSP